MLKIIEVNPNLCTACKYCENICSFRFSQECTPHRARLNIIKFENRGLGVPIICEQCEDAFCMSACPVNGALYRDTNTGAIRVRDERCIGCKSCVEACPFGTVKIDPITRKAIKCDLCGGDPTCVKYCVTGALRYIEVSRAYSGKRLDKAKDLAISLESR